MAAPAPSPLADSTERDPELAARQTLRVMTYNIKHAERAELCDIAGLINEHMPDVVALQEVDQGTERSRFERQAQRLAQLTGMDHAFASALELQPGNYGVALLSRLPILDVETVRLPGRDEPRVLLVADVEAGPDGVVPVGVTHLSLRAQDRRAQTEVIAAHLAPRPWAVLLGDFNAGPWESSLRPLTDQFADVAAAVSSAAATFPSRVPLFRLDYVFASKRWRTADEVYAVASTASDHRPVVAQLRFDSR